MRRASDSSRRTTAARTCSSTTPPSSRRDSGAWRKGRRWSSSCSRAPRARRPRTSARSGDRNPPRLCHAGLRGRGRAASTRPPLADGSTRRPVATNDERPRLARRCVRLRCRHYVPRVNLVSTGIEGLDVILGGGLPPGRLYLVQGDPGAGKTTLGLQFLLEGRRRGEPVLYVSLSETRDELLAVAASHGMDLDGVPIFELAADDSLLRPERQNTLFEPSEVELAEVTRALLAEVDRVKPQRVVFDSLSELRLLAQSPLRYRRQLLALKQHFI